MACFRNLCKSNKILSVSRGIKLARNIYVHPKLRSQQAEAVTGIDKSLERSTILKRIEDELSQSRPKEITWQDIEHEDVCSEDEFKGISLERGKTGIFDVEELVLILKQEGLNNVAVISVPQELQYVDYLVIATGKSPKQMVATAGFIRKISKRRCIPEDYIPVIEGRDSKDWIAMDLGNIALHIFSAKFRKMYDLETLWTVGPEYDDLTNITENESRDYAQFMNQGQ